MVKIGRNKLKVLKKLNKKQNVTTTTTNVSNKILKKKFNAEKKVTFQKEVLLKETAKKGSELVKNVSIKQILSDDSQNKTARKQTNTKKVEKPKVKAVEKQKKRQKSQISDTKLLLKLMQKK